MVHLEKIGKVEEELHKTLFHQLQELLQLSEKLFQNLKEN